MADLNQFLAGSGKYFRASDRINEFQIVSYTVPSGKFFLAHDIDRVNTTSGTVLIDGVNTGQAQFMDSSYPSALLFSAGTTFQLSTGAAKLSIRGFLGTLEDL